VDDTPPFGNCLTNPPVPPANCAGPNCFQVEVTDPSTGLPVLCDWIATNSNYSHTFPDDFITFSNNVMGFNGNDCYSEFTMGQIIRMNARFNCYWSSTHYAYGPDYYSQRYLTTLQNHMERGLIGTSPADPIDEIIVIESGSDVNLKSDRYFGPNGGIVIEHGARLTIDGAKLTAANLTNNTDIPSGSDINFNQRWQGITVLGCGNTSQQTSAANILNGTGTTTQGLLVLLDGSTIEQTTIGAIAPSRFVDPSGTLPEFSTEQNTVGGIIISEGSNSNKVTFSDNMFGIVFNGTRDQPSHSDDFEYVSSSSIKYTDFTTNTGFIPFRLIKPHFHIPSLLYVQEYSQSVL